MRCFQPKSSRFGRRGAGETKTSVGAHGVRPTRSRPPDRDSSAAQGVEVVEIPGVGLFDAGFEVGLSLPPEALQAGDVEQFAGGAVGFVGVEDDVAGVADDGFEGKGEFADGDFLAGADVDEVGLVVGLHEEDQGVGQVIDEEEFPQGFAGAPDGNGGGLVDFGFVKFAQQGGEDVGGGKVEVVVDAVEVGGHGGNEVDAVLPTVVFAEFEAGDFGDRVGFVGRL